MNGVNEIHARLLLDQIYCIPNASLNTYPGTKVHSSIVWKSLIF
jgi:hypothetical protein